MAKKQLGVAPTAPDDLARKQEVDAAAYIFTVADTAPTPAKFGHWWVRPATGVASVWVPTSSGTGAWFTPAGSGGGSSGGSAAPTHINMGDVSGAVTLDLSTARAFTLNLTGDTVLTLSNVPTGSTALSDLRVRVRGSGHVLTWFSGARFSSDAPPILSTGGSDLFRFSQMGTSEWIGLRETTKFNLELPAYRYWAVYTTANNGDGYVVISELEFRIVSGGADVSTPSSPTFASASDGGPSSGLVDDGTSYWAASTSFLPTQAGVDLGTPQVVVELVITSAVGPNYAPKDFIVRGSTNGTVWNDVKAFTNVTGWSSAPRVFDLT